MVQGDLQDGFRLASGGGVPLGNMTTATRPSPVHGILGIAAAIGAALAFVGFGPANAAVTSVSGVAVKVAAPASVVEDAYESDTEMRVFDERQDGTLADPLMAAITR